MSVTAILVTYNSSHVVLEAIASALAQPEITRIVIVDNASGDETCARVREKFPSVEIMAGEENIGFGCANNLALAKVTTPYALLLNPDAVLTPRCVAALLRVMQKNPECAIAAPTLSDESGRILETYKRNVFMRERHKYAYREPEGDLCADFLSGAVLLLRMQHFADGRFFNPDLFLYYEDDDICMKARNNGFSLILCKDASAIHSVGKSSDAAGDLLALKQHHLMLSRLIIEEQYRGPASAAKLAAKWWLRYRLQAFGAFLTFQMRRLRIYLARLSGIMKYRQRVKTRAA